MLAKDRINADAQPEEASHAQVDKNERGDGRYLCDESLFDFALIIIASGIVKVRPRRRADVRRPRHRV